MAGRLTRSNNNSKKSSVDGSKNNQSRAASPQLTEKSAPRSASHTSLTNRTFQGAWKKQNKESAPHAISALAFQTTGLQVYGCVQCTNQPSQCIKWNILKTPRRRSEWSIEAETKMHQKHGARQIEVRSIVFVGTPRIVLWKMTGFIRVWRGVPLPAKVVGSTWLQKLSYECTCPATYIPRPS